ncbi:hypothetical protein SAMN05660461_4149 [Chitinophaga ginsengisegetis]|uniref:Uncharacterized protein n=1 Tax=Chitinophaga ginsengisegetis TaxID=393003 RepID=A0A1T5P6E7_9BACT|nr:hypothetical protein [Chitinophaga ginsengisegetis]MDR6566265.1 hypothetical protein [Chitinophaga ginsengisegetis]MDR6645995.1 hypothetical protein [Chitinophaga ginsengisegetis]MDR6651413.1 hypothetical protein [Chitinophaga ginsengisegetis]SKD08197.1 hypothetical protein SAMN05660461_4149 [Chitinophaga ginsengisegetis]
MKKRYFLIAILSMVTLLFSCSKEMSNEGEGTQPSNSNCEYAPYTNGSSFSYINVNSAKDTITYTLTVSEDTTINGIVYKKVGNDSVFTCSNCKDGIYTQVASILTFQGYSADSLELTYLKDNVPAGTSWKDTITVNNGGVTTSGILEFTITEKDITKTVNGKNYASVIAVKMDAYAIVFGNPVSVGTISTSYYGKGVGLIEADQLHDTTTIVSYTIKP